MCPYDARGKSRTHFSSPSFSHQQDKCLYSLYTGSPHASRRSGLQDKLLKHRLLHVGSIPCAFTSGHPWVEFSASEAHTLQQIIFSRLLWTLELHFFNKLATSFLHPSLGTNNIEHTTRVWVLQESLFCETHTRGTRAYIGPTQ